jgi:hypothetical protein
MRLGRATALAAIGVGVQLWIDGALRLRSPEPDGQTAEASATAAEAGSSVPISGAGRYVLATGAETPVGTAGASADVPDRAMPPPIRAPEPAAQSAPSAADAEDEARRKDAPRRASAALRRVNGTGMSSAPPSVVPRRLNGKDEAPVSVSPVEPRPTLASRRGPVPIASVAGVAPITPPQHAVRIDETESIRRVLHQYQHAVERMDARAAQAVWPSLDARALARAFTGLESHSLAFEDCGITISRDAVAQAQCRAVATYLPKVGRRKPVNASHEYTFTFTKTDGDWQIDSAAIR